ncbi:CBO0543 family protein [Neobacillus sp. PS2-9]|uniref:CBO0543 family protein n=1 Tax=Neobacillus sp. PS2-9 TaxID=3070676 RepID=UPI0027E04F4D|nr:CBO0543 family protein [Neobacillus sp. PS2-9]WML58612.1 CBO0543 family protein [Neobacillus sp. PS2-9]
MRLEWWILLAVWILTTGMLFFIPKKKIRLAVTAFLFKQGITWIFGLIVVEYGMLTYPVRLFADVNRSSFTYEFYVYPAVCAMFNVFYPYARSKLIQFLYYCAYCTVLTVPEIFLEKYTDLIHYLNWAWYWTWITLFLTFAATRWFCVWFFKGIEKEMDDSAIHQD